MITFRCTYCRTIVPGGRDVILPRDRCPAPRRNGHNWKEVVVRQPRERCGSGWTNDHCAYWLGHDGPHDNESYDSPASRRRRAAGRGY